MHTLFKQAKHHIYKIRYEYTKELYKNTNTKLNIKGTLQKYKYKIKHKVIVELSYFEWQAHCKHTYKTPLCGS